MTYHLQLSADELDELKHALENERDDQQSWLDRGIATEDDIATCIALINGVLRQIKNVRP